jgi:hypothetical protein
VKAQRSGRQARSAARRADQVRRQQATGRLFATFGNRGVQLPALERCRRTPTRAWDTAVDLHHPPFV